jgi:hypothetical protein
MNKAYRCATRMESVQGATRLEIVVIAVVGSSDAMVSSVTAA